MSNDHLKNLITDHCAAMLAQVDNPNVKLECLSSTHWVVPGVSGLANEVGTLARTWHRLAPATRLVPLDQSDFLGDRRVTHVRPKGNRGSYLVMITHEDHISIAAHGIASFKSLLSDEWQCSRDNGATWQACSKEAKP